MNYVQKTNLFLARLTGISANSNKNYRRYNFQAFANIFGNFRKIFGNFRKYNISGKLTSLFLTIVLSCLVYQLCTNADTV